MLLLKRISGMSSNTKIVAKNTIFAFIIKGGSLAISFLNTPFLIKYFHNNEILGLWFTIFAVLNWFLAFDLGIGNGIRNYLVKALTNNDTKKAKHIISSGIIAVGGITILLTIIGLLLINYCNVNRIFNVSTEVISQKSIKICASIVFCSLITRFFLTLINSVFYALQMASVNNFLTLCSSILLFIYVVMFRFNNSIDSLFYISIAFLIISNIPILIAGIIVFCTKLKMCKPSYLYVNKDSMRQIIGIGSVFFLCQIFYLIIANTNEFFISHFWSPKSTVDYSFYYRITMLLGTMISLALSPTWSMVTKAYEEKNHLWITHLFRVFKFTGLGIMALQFSIIPFLQWIMDLWLGKGQITVDIPTAIAFACFGTSFLYSSMLSTIVCGMAKMNVQLFAYGFGSIFKISFIIEIARISNNWAWVIWTNVIVLTIYCIMEQIHLNILLKKMSES